MDEILCIELEKELPGVPVLRGTALCEDVERLTDVAERLGERPLSEIVSLDPEEFNPIFAAESQPHGSMQNSLFIGHHITSY